MKVIGSIVRPVSVFRSGFFLFISLATLFLGDPAFARPHKLRVSDPAVAAELKARGARVLADYGGFQLLETDEATPALTKANRVEPADESDFIELNVHPLDTRATEVVALRKTITPFAGKRLHLVQFVGPVKPEWRGALEPLGVTVVHYIPQNAYLVHGDNAALAKLQAWAAAADFVQWEGSYADDYKIHPRARILDAKGNSLKPATDTFAVQLLDDADANPATLALIEQLKLEPVKQQFRTLNYLNVIVRLPPEKLAELAARPEVISIQPHAERHKMDERQDQIMAGNLTGNVPNGPGYLAWLASKGFTQAQFTASGFVVDVSDSGMDNGTTSPGHFGLYQSGDPGQPSRVAYNRLEGTANPGSTLQGCDGHGNLNTHIIAGYNDRANGFPHTDAPGFHYGLGVCPFVMVGSSVIFDTDNFTSPNYADLQSRAYRDGARVSNNSWGADTTGAYDVDAQTYDALVRDAQPSGSSVPNTGNQQMVIVFAAGNAGPNATTVGSPGTAKNVIVVGAAENVHSHSTANGGNSATGSDGCGTLDTEADSANDIASFSSRGPCADGRQKPDLVAPGTHITGGVGQSVLTTNGNGTAISCFKGTGVCGLTGGGTVGSADNFFPLGQQFFTTSSGTSHSTPGVVGACALLRQYFINASLTPPSPAMTKAFLVNSARYMTGMYAGDTLPSASQGMGAVNLGTAFDGVARVLRDQLSADKFTGSGQTRTLNGTVVDSSKPFRVTLAWTDAPGNTTGNAYNNNLDLTVTVGGNTYKGNVFSGGTSITGGTADGKNNVESVLLPAGVTGSFVVTVTAVNIVSDGVPNEAPTLDQDYALVIYNGTETAAPVINGDSPVLTAESCSPTNGVVDPDETVTMNFVLRNVGSLDTANLVATLLATNGVTSPSDAQTYGALIAGGSAVTQAFSFTAVGGCGSNIVATLALTDGTTNLGSVTFTIPLGQLGPIYSQNFDGVAAPALPPGWTTSAGGSQSSWVTTSTVSDTAPNAVFSPDPGSTGSNELISETFLLPSGISQLSFRHRYDLETSFDGGVLEIKIGAGAFADILTAGGSFASGGYVQALSSGNALGARAAWTGTSTSFSTVLVNLPANAAGQSVQFRWRCGTDSSVARAGWWMDSVSINGALCCGAVFPPAITTQPQSQTVSAGDPAGFSVAAIGQNPLSYQWYFNSNSITSATNTSYAIASISTNDAGSYFVIVTNGSGSATSSVASLTVRVSPLILTNPASLTVSTGSTAGFSVTASGLAPLGYQWQFNGADLVGANTNAYAITNVQLSDAGNYTVIVTNFAGSVTSAPGALTVIVANGGGNYTGTLIGWDMNGLTGGSGNFGASPLTPTTNAPNVTVVGLTRGSGVATTGSSATRAWGGVTWTDASAAAAITANRFVTFGVTANSGYKVSCSSVSRFDYRRSGGGPVSGVLQYQIGSGIFTDITNLAYSTSSSSGASIGAIDLSGIAALQNVGPGTNVVFRIVNYAGNSGGTWYVFDAANSTSLDLAIQGSVASLTVTTNPPAAPPVLTLLNLVNNQFQFILTGTVGSNYVIEISTNLTGNLWTPVQTGAAPVLFVDPATNDQRFYRGRILP